MARQVVIVGGGAVGTSLACTVAGEWASGHRHRRQRGAIPRLQRELSTDVVTVGNGTDPAVLEAAGIRQARRGCRHRDRRPTW